jgi:hypothetical protein
MSLSIRFFSLQRLERILNDVKSIYGTHESAETRKLYDLFGAFGGPVQVGMERVPERKPAHVDQNACARCWHLCVGCRIGLGHILLQFCTQAKVAELVLTRHCASAFPAALELLKATDCRTVKVYQALSDIVSCNLYHLTCKLGPSHDAVRSYADLTYQWEQLLKLAPHHVQLTLTDNFQGLIREVCCPSSEKLDALLRMRHGRCSISDHLQGQPLCAMGTRPLPGPFDSDSIYCVYIAWVLTCPPPVLPLFSAPGAHAVAGAA